MPDYQSDDFYAELDSRQDSVLLELEDLNRRIEQVLAEYTPNSDHPCPHESFS